MKDSDSAKQKVMGDEDTTQPLPRALVDVENRLSALERKFVERGYDTRPLFEAHDAAIKLLENAVGEIRASLNNRPPPELVFQAWAFFTPDGDGPYCPHCYESQQIRRHLRVVEGKRGEYFCTICENMFYEPGSGSHAEKLRPVRSDPLRGYL